MDRCSLCTVTPITISLSPLPDGERSLVGFTHFWLRYVHGFSPHFHCQKSLRGSNDRRFHLGMQLGESFELLPPEGYRHIYLCGVTSHKVPGLHLALLPEPIGAARVLTYNGMEITVNGARQLDIPDLPDGYAGMSRKYTTCCNWQFGVRYYGLAGLRRDLVKRLTSARDFLFGSDE